MALNFISPSIAVQEQQASFNRTQELLGEDFSTFLKNNIGTVKLGETASLHASVGQVDVLATLTAVNNAENALSTIVALRDRSVAAYQEVMRMTA